MRILGIDYGLRKIGLAVSEGILAEPLVVFQNTPRTILEIKRLCEKQAIDKIVVGLPESGIVGAVKKFGKVLERKTDLPIVYQPETLTSKDALVKMIQGGRGQKFRRQQEDAVAAAIILQSYLEGD